MSDIARPSSKRDRDRCSLPRFAHKRQPGAVHGHDMLYDGQSQPRAAGRLRPAFVHSVEPLEDPLLTFFRNTDPRILHPQSRLSKLTPQFLEFYPYEKYLRSLEK